MSQHIHLSVRIFNSFDLLDIVPRFQVLETSLHNRLVQIGFRSNVFSPHAFTSRGLDVGVDQSFFGSQSFVPDCVDTNQFGS